MRLIGRYYSWSKRPIHRFSCTTIANASMRSCISDFGFQTRRKVNTELEQAEQKVRVDKKVAFQPRYTRNSYAQAEK
ncbi:hypothetical protein BDD16_003559 [Sphaerotilus montanus]|uniref:Uncharacterized protein n=1 Tax=Sphaerotilus montanus TaxID=522889 RepID=A0A7Y9U6Z1_9BURK|nr:hypothetical protein [Sphaerotilus montanus]